MRYSSSEMTYINCTVEIHSLSKAWCFTDLWFHVEGECFFHQFSTNVTTARCRRMAITNKKFILQ